MIKEFKEFIMRGSVLDLAVGVIIGSAFTAIVNQVVKGLITPLIGLFFTLFSTDQKKALNILNVNVNGVEFAFGDVISAIITFLITGIVLFIVVKTANRAKSLRKTEPEVEEEEVATAEDYLAEIRDLLKEQAPTNNEKLSKK